MAKANKNWEKKLNKSFKVYFASKKEALTLFEKKTGLFKASIQRHETYQIPQFVYDLHVDNVVYYREEYTHVGGNSIADTKTVIETYDTFDEAVTALLSNLNL